MIQFTCDGVEMPPLKQTSITRWIHAVAAGYGFTIGTINYIFCSDARELQVNQQFLNHDYYTDVITFDYSSAGQLSGDIFISWDTIQSNAIKNNTELETELLRILIHGILHLTGQGDKTPDSKLQMTAKEDLALGIWSQFTE